MPFVIRHAAEGSTWKHHKYLRIENGRYIYPEDAVGGKARPVPGHGRPQIANPSPIDNSLPTARAIRREDLQKPNASHRPSPNQPTPKPPASEAVSDWLKSYRDEQAQAKKRNPNYKPPENFNDFVAELIEDGIYDEDKGNFTQEQLREMFKMAMQKRNNPPKPPKPEKLTAISTELYHFGVLGMHWGIRRTPEQLGNLKTSKKSNNNGETEPIMSLNKQKIIASGNIKAAYANRARFTNDELQQVMDRFNMEMRVKNLAESDVAKGKKYTHRMKDVMTAAIDVSTTGIKLYNNVAGISNAFSKNGKKMPIIVTGSNKK